MFGRTIEDNEAQVGLWDNFSKMYRIKIADMRRTNLADCLWTGVAIRKYTGDAKVSMACITDGSFHVDHAIVSVGPPRKPPFYHGRVVFGGW
jgi:hypothetical protein